MYFKKSSLDNLHARIGLSVSKKAGKANRRNLIKRLLREEFRVHDIKSSNLDIVVIASHFLKNKDVSNAKISRSIRDAFSGILNKEHDR